MKSRRILFIVTKLNQGGAIVVPLQVASALRARGYDAEVWFLYRESPAYEDEPGIRLIFPDRPGGIWTYSRIFFRALRAMQAFRPDAVHGVLPLGNLFGLVGAAVIGCSSRVASQHVPLSWNHPVMRWLDMMLGSIGVYTANIAVSHAVEESFAHHPNPYRRRLQVIQNAVPYRPPQRTRSEARRHFGLPEQAWVLGNLGRLTYQKNQDFLFPVLERLEGVHLAIAGTGELEQQYVERIRQNGLDQRVHLLGSIDRADVPDFLNAIDVFVLPSRFEGLPLALLEAMTAGLPIVASDITPSREVLWPEGQERAGLLLSIDSEDEWIETLGEVLHDPKQLGLLADAATRRAKEFEVDRMVDRYELCLLGTRG